MFDWAQHRTVQYSGMFDWAQYRTMLQYNGMFHCAEAPQMAPAGAVQLGIENMGKGKKYEKKN